MKQCANRSALNSIYVEGARGELMFRPVSPPSGREVAPVADRFHRRVAKLMERRGLGSQADPDEDDTLWHEEPLLAELYSASISGRIATGPHAGKRVARVGDEVDVDGDALTPGRCFATVSGYSVHAGVCVPAHDRMRLARYSGRPPLATERLSLLPDGRLLYQLTRRWRDGTTHVIFEPLQLMERLAALVPPPKFNITRCSEVLAPGATFRPLVAPREENNSPLLAQSEKIGSQPTLVSYVHMSEQTL